MNVSKIVVIDCLVMLRLDVYADNIRKYARTCAPLSVKLSWEFILYTPFGERGVHRQYFRLEPKGLFEHC